MTNPIFTANSITINGFEHPTGYSITPSGKVFAFMDFDGVSVRVDYEPRDDFYAEALAAAKASRGERDVEQSAPVEPEPVESETAEPESAEYESAEPEPVESEPAEPARSSEPVDKPWIGSSIKGKGWEICFDGVYGKTRVIFKKPPCGEIKKLVKDAGFYYSPSLKSWNKGLTCKAYRAAVKLAADLRYYPNKPLFTEAG